MRDKRVRKNGMQILLSILFYYTLGENHQQ